MLPKSLQQLAACLSKVIWITFPITEHMYSALFSKYQFPKYFCSFPGEKIVCNPFTASLLSFLKTSFNIKTFNDTEISKFSHTDTDTEIELLISNEKISLIHYTVCFLSLLTSFCSPFSLSQLVFRKLCSHYA